MSENHKMHFSEFKKVSKAEWAKKATEDLKGADVFEKYNWQLEGITLQPYYDQSDTVNNALNATIANRQIDSRQQGEARYWVNVQPIVVGDAKQANQKALLALYMGAEGIEFDLAKFDQIDFEVLLNDILVEYCQINFINISIPMAMHYLNKLAEHNKLDKAYGAIKVNLDLDNPDTLIALIKAAKKAHKVQILSISADNHTGIIDEISTILIKTNRLIRSLMLHGIEISTIANQLQITTSVGTDYFIEIAKIRTIRHLLFQIIKAYGHETFLPEQLQIQGVVTSWENEKYQPHANMLKGSTAAMAAVLGGCNTLTVMPDELDSPLKERIARNVSNILKEEVFLNKTADPVAGTYYIENLADQLAQQSWLVFQKDFANQTLELN